MNLRGGRLCCCCCCCSSKSLTSEGGPTPAQRTGRRAEPERQGGSATDASLLLLDVLQEREYVGHEGRRQFKTIDGGAIIVGRSFRSSPACFFTRKYLRSSIWIEKLENPLSRPSSTEPHQRVAAIYLVGYDRYDGFDSPRPRAPHGSRGRQVASHLFQPHGAGLAVVTPGTVRARLGSGHHTSLEWNKPGQPAFVKQLPVMDIPGVATTTIGQSVAILNCVADWRFGGDGPTLR